VSNWIAIAQLVATALILPALGVLGWFVHTMWQASQKRVERAEDDIREIRRDYVIKEDFLREDSSNRHLLQRLTESVAGIEGKLGTMDELREELRLLRRAGDGHD